MERGPFGVSFLVKESPTRQTLLLLSGLLWEGEDGGGVRVGVGGAVNEKNRNISGDPLILQINIIVEFCL